MFGPREKGRLAPLRATDLFAGCTDIQLAGVDNLLTQVAVRARADAVAEGDYGREFFIIRDGWVRLSRHGEEIGRLGPGSFFGEIALLDRGLRTATVWAESDLQVWVMNRPEFRELLWRIPAVEEQVVLAAERRRDSDALVGSAR